MKIPDKEEVLELKKRIKEAAKLPATAQKEFKCTSCGRRHYGAPAKIIPTNNPLFSYFLCRRCSRNPLVVKKVTYLARGQKKVELVDAQGEFERRKREAETFRNEMCPRKCKGRTDNRGKCDPYNCVKLLKGNPGLGVLKEMTGERKVSRIKRLKKRDRVVLSSISREFKHRDGGKTISSDLKTVFEGQKEINRQLRSVGLRAKHPRMPKPKNVKQINEIRAKMGLQLLIANCYRCDSDKIRRLGAIERKAKQYDYICYTCGHRGVIV